MKSSPASETTVEPRLPAIARRLWPDLVTFSEDELTNGVANVLGFLYAAPLALVGLGWLVAVTDLALIRDEWPTLLLFLALAFLLRQLEFTFFIEVEPGSYADWRESLAIIIAWSAALLFGPTALWFVVLWAVASYANRWRRSTSAYWRWGLVRNLALELTQVSAGLVALALYERWGGTFPVIGLASLDALLAFGATGVRFVLARLCWLPLLSYYSSVMTAAAGRSSRSMLRFIAIVMALPGLIDPFAILAAGLYTRIGRRGYLFFALGLLLTSALARQLGKAAVRSRQRSREMEKLEQLGRAIINAPPDGSALPAILEQHVPGMFSANIEIRLFPDRTVLRHPPDRPPAPGSAWQWLHTTSEADYFSPGAVLPWGGRLTDQALVLTPILDSGSKEPIGGIYLSPRQDVEAISNLLPAVQSLAAQIASALNRAEVYKVEQELALAGRIQASFLPSDLPAFEGWQLAATLEPAKQTSGDFYDFVPLPNRRLGIVIADVADKGTGAALYMALSRTLIRTYAIQYHARPDYVLRVANRRILMDTDSDLFVTVFYGVLDPHAGTLTYCNAGHNPPYLLSGQSGTFQALTKTGMALGVYADATWEQTSVQIAPGDLLVLYTDGITDAQDSQGTFFDSERLLEVAQTNLGRPAQDVQDALLAAVHAFTGNSPQFDDITLMTLIRES